MSVTILEISKSTGFSKSTVQRALTDSHDVNPRTRAKIIEYAEKKNYKPNFQARSLVGAKTFIIGIMVPYLNLPNYAEIISGVEKEATDNRYNVLVFCSENDHLKQLRLIEWIKYYGVEGFIIVPALEADQRELLDSLEICGIANIGIHNCGDRDIISSGEEIGAFRAVEYLIKLGHRRIGHITIDQPVDWGIKHKLDGYIRALKTYGIAYDDSLVVCKDKYYAFGSGYEATRELLQIPNPPTAIFALSDTIAVGVADGIKSLGLKIPDDVSLIGYDNKDFAQVMEPKLTTVLTHFDEIGKRAAKILIQKIENPDFNIQKIICEPELIIRASCINFKQQKTVVSNLT